MSIKAREDTGFSLLEVVIALSILSSCVLLFSFALSQIGTTRSMIKDDRQIEWHLFVNQLEHDLAGSQDVSTTRERLTFETFDTVEQRMRTITYERYLKIIRRQIGSLGHQPMLLEVSSIRFAIVEETLTIQVDFFNGETYCANFRVNEKR